MLSTLILINVNPVRGLSSIHIWPDGLVEPSNAPIQRNGDVYTLTGDINAALTVEKSGIVIDGKSHLLQSDEHAKALSLVGVNNVVIKNIAISNSRYAVYAENSTSITLENNDVADCGDGFVFEGCNQNLIKNNELNSINYNSIYFGDSSYNTVSGNKLDDCNTFINGENSNGNKIFDNNWNIHSSPFYNGINLRTQSSNNMIYDNIGSGVVALAGNNNSIYRNSLSYISLLEPEDGLYSVNPFTNCTVYNNHVGSITLSMTSYSKVFNNTITGRYNEGVHLMYAASFNEITGNTLTGSNIFVEGGSASVGGSLDCTNNIISENIVVTDKQVGIEIEEGQGSRVLSNIIQAKDSQGIRINCYGSSPFDITVSGNIVLNSLCGIYVEGTNNQPCNVFSGNLLTSNMYGVFIHGSAVNVISGNNISSNVYGLYTEQALARTEPQEFYTVTNSTITGNLFSKNTFGIYFNSSSQKNNVTLNNFEDNNIGIGVGEDSSRNLIYNNNFVNNNNQVSFYPWRENLNTTYPTGGNYWSDYTGQDQLSGPNQTSQGSDTMGDTPHVLDQNNNDYYPFLQKIETPKLETPQAPLTLPEFPQQTEPEPSTQPTTPPQTTQPADETQTPTTATPELPASTLLMVVAVVTTVFCVSLGVFVYFKRT
ncbi:MAG: NosD domain-containing protein [Candidatus Bathyarchaeia archaeon]